MDNLLFGALMISSRLTEPSSCSLIDNLLTKLWHSYIACSFVNCETSTYFVSLSTISVSFILISMFTLFPIPTYVTAMKTGKPDISSCFFHEKGFLDRKEDGFCRKDVCEIDTLLAGSFFYSSFTSETPSGVSTNFPCLSVGVAINFMVSVRLVRNEGLGGASSSGTAIVNLRFGTALGSAVKVLTPRFIDEGNRDYSSLEPQDDGVEGKASLFSGTYGDSKLADGSGFGALFSHDRVG